MTDKADDKITQAILAQFAALDDEVAEAKAAGKRMARPRQIPAFRVRSRIITICPDASEGQVKARLERLAADGRLWRGKIGRSLHYASEDYLRERQELEAFEAATAAEQEARNAERRAVEKAARDAAQAAGNELADRFEQQFGVRPLPWVQQAYGGVYGEAYDCVFQLTAEQLELLLDCP